MCTTVRKTVQRLFLISCFSFLGKLSIKLEICISGGQFFSCKATVWVTVTWQRSADGLACVIDTLCSEGVGSVRAV